MAVKRINRRAMLRGTSGALLALPRLDVMAQSDNRPELPMRMACIGLNFGLVPELFFPKETGSEYLLTDRLRPLDDLRNQFTVFSGLDHGVNAQGGHGGVHAFLSGVLSKNAAGMPEANISVDQKAAQYVGSTTRFTSLQFSSGNDPNNVLSWTASGVSIPPENRISAIYNQLFRKTNPDIRDRSHRELAARASILDLVRTDARSLQRSVGAEDRRKLNRYFESVRSVERRLQQTKQWLDHPKPSVEYAPPESADRTQFKDRIPLYYDLMALAFETDSTRIITLGLADIGANYGGFDLSRGYHQLTHHGKVPEYITELSIIEQFHMEQLSRFLSRLSETQEIGGQPLLDNCMVLFGSGMGNASSHSNRNLPLILAGGGFRHGQHLSCFRDPEQTLTTRAAKLYVSMLQRFGLEVDRFAEATGTLSGLQVGG